MAPLQIRKIVLTHTWTGCWLSWFSGRSRGPLAWITGWKYVKIYVMAQDDFKATITFAALHVRGHLNNTWHFFLAYFRPPSTLCHFVSLAQIPFGVTWQFSFYIKHSFLKTFAVKFSLNNRQKMKRDIWDPSPLCHVLFVTLRERYWCLFVLWP